MSAALPDGFRIHRPTIDDAEAILDVVRAHDIATIGEPDITIEDVLELMQKPGHHLDADEWLVSDAAGTLTAWGYVDDSYSGERVRIDVNARPDNARPVIEALVEVLLARAGELAAEKGLEGMRVRASAPHGATDLRAVYEQAGFELDRYYGRMNIDLTGDERAPEPPEGVEVKVFTELPDRDEAARIHHRIMDTGFADLDDHVSIAFDTWWANTAASGNTPYDEWRVVFVEGEPAAVLQTANIGAADNGGWIRNLVVHPGFRGRGLAQLLLGTAFALFAEKGRTWVGLSVDTGNSTGAFKIYEKVGMRPKYMIDVLKAWVPASSPAADPTVS
ncbi:GNAT family N-acetyltransferase [Phytomonospora sp. NPDC050363]|uniref:GNAT family N-acetyltransferase n=1 Tax=Phytomonospora sp. NPDC050363 TaxID=3155642 RepID=UPI0033D4665C